ncbi:MAG: UDP-N-acetylglucosamine 1-carboxyvinyltransferase, partial [Oscillospiraceae bacterium]|nr:UDP-N-acetylglucosamine 1-carboxyvinyltransferase [Oscillospiraceae bacterium]
EGTCIIENVPNISDVGMIMKILSQMGAEIKLINKNTVEINTEHIYTHEVSHEMARNLRGSYYLMGALISRFGRAKVSMPGGCNLGVRPIDQHIKGFEALGTTVNLERGMVDASCDNLLGTHIYLDIVSVGATMNIMLAAVKAKGLTVIENAAKEPHIVDLANFLNSMGADVRGAGTDVIKIHGVQKMHGTTYSIIPDQIEAGTFMVAAAATGGNVLIKNVIPKHLESITNKLVKAGAEVIEYDDAVRVIGKDEFTKVNIKTAPHPGFPTDMQPQMATLLSIANGTSIITEGIYDSRFKYVDELRRMGANIQVDGKVAVIQGVNQLVGAPVKAVDLRAGAAMVIAGLVANGTTEIEDIYHIERGYEDLVSKLRGIGADIKKIDYPSTDMSVAL